MDHGNLRAALLQKLALFLIVMGLSACAAKSPTMTRATGPAKTVLASDYAPRKVFEISEKYLEYHLGYSLLIRDLDRGLIVSDWVASNASERQQITLRVAQNDNGSLVSAHVKTEGFDENGWRDVPTSGDREAVLLDKLDTYLQSQKAKK